MEKRILNFGRWLRCLVITTLLLAVMTVPAMAADWNGAQHALVSGMEREQATIDLSAYRIPTNEFKDRYNQWEDFGEFPWYVRGASWTYYTSSGYVAAVTPNYLPSWLFSRGEYEAEIQRILDEALCDGMGQWTTALALYDYLAVHVAYSEDLSPGEYNIIRNAYGAIVDGDAVCVGYAKAYQELLQRCGIPCVVVGSDAMDHRWNMVKIGNHWYHVDVTWADPIDDVNGRVSHEYFLLSDATISDADHKHTGWTPYYRCNDYSFENGVFWEDTSSQITYLDKSVSFLRRGDAKEITIVRRDSYTAEETVVCRVKPSSISLNGSQTKYYYANYGLSLWEDTLYFSDPTHVYRVAPGGGEPEVIYTYNHQANGRYIIGSFVRDDTIYITTNDGQRNYQKFSIPLPWQSHTHNYRIDQVESTCMREGHTAFTCSCGSRFTSGYLDRVDHQGQNAVVMTEPTWTGQGLKLSDCRWCGKELRETLPALYSVSGTFSDVSTWDYYCEPVLWAYVRGVTSGTSEGTFSPNDVCTRGQVVTFLWRAMGEPEPSSSYNPFYDVNEGEYYYKAVLWAVENGITSGTGWGTFSPYAPCTRAHVVTFLHRAAGTPGYIDSRYPFVDVVDGSYYIDAMIWAVENSITSGVDVALFAPDNPCTRGQTVTFLHRYFT